MIKPGEVNDLKDAMSQFNDKALKADEYIQQLY